MERNVKTDDRAGSRKKQSEQVTPAVQDTTGSNGMNEKINHLVQRACQALDQMMMMSQDQVDRVIQAMSTAGLDAYMKLAKAAVEATGRGIYEDKMTKNIFATEYVYNSIKNDRTVGVINENDYEDYVEVAEPVGVIAAVTPVTNPTSTTLFKSLIALKTRNPIIFAFHPSAQRCSAEAAEIMYQAAVKAGAPAHSIQWISEPSLQATNQLMNHPDVALILATGGSSLVQAAYSAGKPALGVGPGNVPCYIEKTANIRRAATDLIMSKTFDNGMICASEQAVIVDRAVVDEFERFMKENGCVFLDEVSAQKLQQAVIKPGKAAVKPEIVGRPAAEIAAMAGIEVPPETKILLVKPQGVGPDYPLSTEKLSPILAYYQVEDADEGICRAEEVISFGGLGHSAVIHTEDETVAGRFADHLKASRLIINSPSSHGAIGDIYNTNMPSLTLGCGSYGRNATGANVTAVNLVNKKRVARRRVNMQWFKIPEKIYFEFESTQYLEQMPDISRAFIVTDPTMVRFGYVDKILYYLRKRLQPVQISLFSDVEPDPDIETIRRGVEEMNRFQPDVIIALGGGSAIDAAKGMWLFYENPDLDFHELTLKFMDIRKRIVKFPHLGRKTKLVAIPTTSGTGSEVTSFAVITDRHTQSKYPLADYELTPDVAIIDPDFVMSVPPVITADTGMDVLTHAIEAYVSSFASDYTDALAMHAIKLVFEWLPKAYAQGSDRKAREKLHNASTIAGMAFSNAFLGINHSLAHKLGGAFHIPHGRSNAILLPHVIRYNASKPSKFVSFPKYESFIADERYAQIAAAIGLPSASVAEGVQQLVQAVQDLMSQLNMPQRLRDCAIDETQFMAAVPDLAERAFADQCTGTNPRMPLINELEHLLRQAW
ncbi:MAG: bifunctional acetaldehyde-CoA/alcohol dehydrogenase [Ruminococcaceae bacterium]|nr:bifunctional acetaldehyde-CoA/alcohol dehydrogenase [Oscillospiraceae bacterium]